MKKCGLAPLPDESRRVSHGDFSSFEDFPRLIELARSGLLGRGARLAKIGLTLAPAADAIRIEAERNVLAFHDLIVRARQSEAPSPKTP